MDEVMEKLTTFFYDNNDLQLFALNGSRVDGKRRPDKFQDYDVVFFTENIQKYRENPSFLNLFGELLILSEPDGLGSGRREKTFEENQGYIFLAQFSNGLRLDMQFLTLDLLEDYLKGDSLTQIIGDKNKLVKTLIIPTDKDYCLLLPEEAEIDYCVKEFWWQYLNTLKSTVRDQFLLAQSYLNLVREELITLMTYAVTTKNKREINYGKKNDQLFQLIHLDDVERIKSSFDTSSNQKIFDALKSFAHLEIIYLELLDENLDNSLPRELFELKNSASKYLLSKGEPELAMFFSERNRQEI